MMVKSHKHTLAQSGPAPFTIVPLSSLRTRAVEEPLPCSIQPSMSITQLPDNIPLPRSAEEVLASDGIRATSIVDNTGLGIGEMISVNDDTEIFNQPQMMSMTLRLKEKNLEFLH